MAYDNPTTPENIAVDENGVIAAITVTSPGSGFTGLPGGSISIFRDEQIDRIAEQIWIALNPSHGDWEYAASPEIYRKAAREAVRAANTALGR